MRAELLGDETTRRIAATLGVPVAEYVELVLEFAKNPEQEPVLEVAGDDDGEGAPSPEDVARWARQLEAECAASTAIVDHVAREDERRLARQLTGGPALLPPGPAPPAARDPTLDGEVLAARCRAHTTAHGQIAPRRQPGNGSDR